MDSHFNSVQDYIDGLLDAEDLARFEERLAVDVDLQNEVNRQQEIRGILTKRLLSKEKDLQDTLAQVSHDFRSKPRGIMVRMKRYIIVTSAACVLILVGLFFMDRTNELYALPEMQSEIVRGQEQNEWYENAVVAFNNGKYAVARENLEAILKDDPDQVQVQYYLGLSYIGEKKWKSAIAVLRPIADGTSVFGYEAQYYLAVSYYKNGEGAKAVPLLKYLCEEDGLWCEKANKLMEKIN